MSLLPSSSSRLMHVLAECLCDRLAAVPCPGPEAMRPETAPASFVPFLAWGWSVDLWDRGWPIERKRAITAEALEMHRLKGTEVGIRRYLAYTAARDPLFTVPPQDFFLTPRPSEDRAWRDWIEGLPEIRLYQVREPGVMAVGVICDAGDDDMPEICFLGAEEEEAEETFFAADVLLPTETEYAVVVDAEGVRPIAMNRRPDPRVGQKGSVIDFWLPGDAGRGAFLDAVGASDGLDHLDGAPALPQALAVALGPAVATGEGWALVDEQIHAIQDVQPEAGIYEVESLIGLIASADHYDDAILDEADAGLGTYRSIRLVRPGLTMPPAAAFWSDGRLSMAPYTAEIRVAIPEVVGGGPAHLDIGFLDATQVAPESDLSDLHFVCDAVDAARSLRDRVFLDLDIPVVNRSLKATRRLSELQIG